MYFFINTMLVYLLYVINFLNMFYLINGNVETLHFESGCLKDSNRIQLHLRCSLYEHIEIIRVIYGYSKQEPTFQCQFSIYDCIQEGASRNILSCNGKQTCLINLTKNEILMTTVETKGVPVCKDFNYVQVNFACTPDANDICDGWKDSGPVVHISHTHSRDKQYDQCQCKVRSSLPGGQVLLHAKDINRQTENKNEFEANQNSNTDCKKTTYLEIATDRSERKCMQNLPSNGNALFGSGSHNFTLTYIRNDPLSELFFYFELKASPIQKDHHVQIICNWERRTTTIRTTTLPIIHKRKSSTISMVRGGKLSRLDLIRHPKKYQDTDEITTLDINNGEEDDDDEERLTTESMIKSKKRRIKTSTTETIESTTILSSSISDIDSDDWSRIALDDPSDLYSSDNQTLLSSFQASILPNDYKPSQKISKHKLIIMLLLVLLITIFIILLYCLKIKQPTFFQRFKINLNVAFLFCCEAGKLLFSPSSSNPSHSLSNSPIETLKHHNKTSPTPIEHYQTSDDYINNIAINCRTTHSIYRDYEDEDYDDGHRVSKSIYNVDDESEYITRYDRSIDGETC